MTEAPLETASRARLFQAASQDSINLVMMRVMPSQLSSVSQDLHGALSVLAPSVVAGLEGALRKGVVRKREGRTAFDGG